MSRLFKFIVVMFTSLICIEVSFADPCAKLPGSWSGEGQLKYFVFTCKYASDAVINTGIPANANIKIRKVSGGFMCPNQGEQNIAVSCHNGKVEMKDSKIDVSGYMADDGKSAGLEGNLYAVFRYHPFKLSVTKN